MRTVAVCSPYDSRNVTAVAAIDGAQIHAFLPHFVVGRVMRADDADMSKFADQFAQLAEFSKVEIQDNDVGELTLDMVSNLVDVASHDDVLEIRVQVGGEMFGDDAVGLSDNDG